MAALDALSPMTNTKLMTKWDGPVRLVGAPFRRRGRLVIPPFPQSLEVAISHLSFETHGGKAK